MLAFNNHDPETAASLLDLDCFAIFVCLEQVFSLQEIQRISDLKVLEYQIKWEYFVNLRRKVCDWWDGEHVVFWFSSEMVSFLLDNYLSEFIDVQFH